MKLFTHPIFKLILTGILAGFEFFFGIDLLVKFIMVLILVFFDTLLAVMYAWKRKLFSAAKLSHILLKLFVYFILISSAHIVETLLNAEVLDEAFIAFISGTELLSILKNAHKLKIPVPAWLLERTSAYRKKRTKAVFRRVRRKK